MKTRYFLSANDLAVFANTAGNVSSITAITFDASSGQFVLFYT